MIYVFDLDGTLIDSTFRHGYLMGRLLREEGIEVEESFWDRYLNLKREGLNSKAVLRDVYGFEEGLVDRVVKKWVEQIESDDSIETLERIKVRGNKIYYLSLRQREDAAIDELKRLGIYDYAEEVFIGKPSEGVQYKVGKLRLLKSIDKIKMVGDTEVDYEAAKNVSSSFVGLYRGFRSKSFWDGMSIHSIKDLKEIKKEKQV